jgi:hypothetical protein
MNQIKWKKTHFDWKTLALNFPMKMYDGCERTYTHTHTHLWLIERSNYGDQFRNDFMTRKVGFLSEFKMCV